MRNIIPEKRLFWFLRDGVELNLAEASILDMYVQQVITRGREEDVRVLLSVLNLKQIKDVLTRVGRFVPIEVKRFWEDFIEFNK